MKKTVLKDEEELVVWDQGRVLVLQDFAPLLSRQGLTSFGAIFGVQASEITKKVLKERVTVRIELTEGEKTHAFYLKRHSPAPLKEYLKSLARLRWPILGARNEWNALRGCERISFPTQTPVACGFSGGYSFLLTLALEGCPKLSELWRECCQHGDSRGENRVATSQRRQKLTRSVARLIRRMHDLGWHHQDCYSGHVMIRPADDQPFLIDLGRARPLRLFRKHWIRKDLAQFLYSVPGCTLSDQFRFLRSYWGRPMRKWESRWCRKILRKKMRIARHAARM